MAMHRSVRVVGGSSVPKGDQHDRTPIRRILATTELGESSDEVLRQAGALAAQAGAELHILHVEEIPMTLRGDASPATAAGRDALQMWSSADTPRRAVGRCGSCPEMWGTGSACLA